MRIDRRDFLRQSVILGGGLSLSRPSDLFAVGTPGSATRPNIIFIVADDQGYGDFSCHGNPVLKTPNLDALRSESVSFTDYHGSPVCSPSRCALLTGRHEFRSGVSHTRGPSQQMLLSAITLPEVLKSAGYTTGIFGKWHLGLGEAYWPSNRGFDEMLTFLTGMIGEFLHDTSIDPILLRKSINDPTASLEKIKGYYTDIFFDQAMAWIKSVQSDTQPFFACIPTGAVHAPVNMPPGYGNSMYNNAVPDPGLCMYFDMVANLDDNVGKLLAYLKSSGLDRNTIVVYTGDNGAASTAAGFGKGFQPSEFFNAGMKGGKNTVDEGGTRLAHFWRCPSLFQGGVEVDRLTSNIDFLPTVAELSGATLPAKLLPDGSSPLDGRSLAPLLKNPKAQWDDRYIFIHSMGWGGPAANQQDKGYAVRNNQFRLLRGTATKGLYDIKAGDRGEKDDVSNQAGNPALIADMEAAYAKWWPTVLPALQEVENTPVQDLVPILSHLPRK